MAKKPAKTTVNSKEADAMDLIQQQRHEMRRKVEDLLEEKRYKELHGDDLAEIIDFDEL